MSINMPNMNGYVAINDYRKLKTVDGQKIFILSGDISDTDHRILERYNADGIIFKPIIPKQLWNCVS